MCFVYVSRKSLAPVLMSKEGHSPPVSHLGKKAFSILRNLDHGNFGLHMGTLTPDPPPNDNKNHFQTGLHGYFAPKSLICQ